MKKLALTLFFITCLLLTPTLAKELRIGVVDMEDIINNSPDYKRIESSLKKKTEELGRPLQQKERELSQQLADFQKQAQAGIIKDDARKRKEMEFQKEIDSLLGTTLDPVKRLEILFMVMSDKLMEMRSVFTELVRIAQAAAVKNQ